MSGLRRVGVLTSGGDSPGMNACIRAVVRHSVNQGIDVVGFLEGYDGILDENYVSMEKKSVAQIIQRGGTILKTARSNRFYHADYRRKAKVNLEKLMVDGLIVIGGDGSFKGAQLLGDEFGVDVVGIPGTIDNDLFGTEATIGFDTALNTVVDCVDKIRDTAYSHNRVFVVEVMGKDAGFIALNGGLAVGAECILVPETKTDINHVLKRLNKRRSSKGSAIVVVAEGDDFGGGVEVMSKIRQEYPEIDVRLTNLGHVQRGGSPSARDRVLASRLGVGAVDFLLSGGSGKMIGIQGEQLVYVSLNDAVKEKKDVDDNLLKMIEVLSL